MKVMNNTSRAITTTRPRYAHVVHSHFARIVISFHCMALSITTASIRCPCVASSSDRTSSGLPNSASALAMRLLLGQPRRLVLGHGIQQMLAQLLPHVLAQRPRTADAAADLIEVLLKLVHRISPECGSRPGTARSTIAPSPRGPPAPSW